jgi:hypothetical protein
LIGGVAHMMLYMNGFWNNEFWITAIGMVLIPLLIKNQLNGRKISSLNKTRNSSNSKNETNDLFAKIEGNCKICGKPLEKKMLDFCSQNCNFEHYLNSQSKNLQKEIEPQPFSKRTQFSYQ